MQEMATVQETRAEMAEAERRYRLAHTEGDEDEVKRQRLRWHGLNKKLPELEVRAADALAQEARRLGEEQRPAAERWMAKAAKLFGELHALEIEGRAIFDTAEAERLERAGPSEHQRCVRAFRSGIGWAEGIQPFPKSYLAWLKAAHESGVVKLPKSVRDDVPWA